MLNPLLRIPLIRTAREYHREALFADLIAAVVVTVMLVPQSLAYALLAGLPAEIGLYASILPLVVYALFGSSRTLSVGPVAVASLMTAVSLTEFAQQGTSEYIAGAVTLAMLSGVFLLLLGIAKLGFLANLLSHPVVSGFITASGILIALSQLKHILGIQAHGETVIDIGYSLASAWGNINMPTILVGTLVIAFLLWSRSGASKLLAAFSMPKNIASTAAKGAPIVGVLVTIMAVMVLNLDERGVSIVGSIPAGLPHIVLPEFSTNLIGKLWLPALMISVIGYVESVSVGKTLATKRQQQIDVDQELIGLGAANIASAFSGAFPVTGGFSRSVVNFDAGAQTQYASIFAACGIGIVTAFFTPALYYLPKATLAATIIVAVLSLLDFAMLRKTWQYSKSDFLAVATTIVVTLLFGVETGVASGVALTIALHLYRTSTPHIAEVGLVEGTEHFRNIRRHVVKTVPEILELRMDESIFFVNAHHLEQRIYQAIYQRDAISQVILFCSAINEIDTSGLEVLEGINTQLMQQGVQLHLAEVKGPVMDSLLRSGFLDSLSGEVFLTQYEAHRVVSGLV